MDLYQTFLSSGDTPFQVRLDALQNQTCFFHSEGPDHFDLSDIDMPIEPEILQGNNNSVILDICLGTLNVDVDRIEARFSVCKVETENQNPLPEPNVISIMMAKQARIPYLWGVQQEPITATLTNTYLVVNKLLG